MMNKNLIYIILTALAMVIAAIIIADFNGAKAKKARANPYALDISSFQTVDPALVHYRETRNIRVSCEEARSIFYLDDRLYIGADSFLQVITPRGRQLLRVDLPGAPQQIYPDGAGKIYVAFQNHIGVYDEEGQSIATWSTLGEKTIITSLALKGDLLFAADAGNRRIVRYDVATGRLLGEFEGKTSFESLHGFIVPSPTFDMGVNSDGELWVVNPGKHSFENYTDEGELRTFWENVSQDIDGFTGCCNPAHLALLPDGSFVTSEKRIVRIKVHKPSGEFESVVAPPDQFEEDGAAPDIAVSPEGIIYALDIDRKMIRVFEKKAII